MTYHDIPTFLQRKPRRISIWPIAVVVIGLCVAGTIINAIIPDAPKTAHADEPIHQNDYYCAHLSQYTNGSDPAIAKFCKSL